MENQLREQGAEDKMDEVLKEIPKVRKDLGQIPLVTPTSQIVGTQAVLNVLTGERYKSITKETAGVLKGEYGATAAPVYAELQARVLDGASAITCRPADNIEDELVKLTDELDQIAAEKSIKLADEKIDDVLTYALFPQIGLKFLENRNNPSAFEPVPTGEIEQPKQTKAGSNDDTPEAYSVSVDGKVYDVVVAPSGELASIEKQGAQKDEAHTQHTTVNASETLNAPLAGNIFKVLVSPGSVVQDGDVVIIMEAMKMETEIRAASSGTIASINIKEGDAVTTGDVLLTLG